MSIKKNSKVIYRSKAPLRISFGGGGTDISPYPEDHGGFVLNATINKFAYSSLTLREDKEINIHSLDYGTYSNYQEDESIKLEDELHLVRAICKKMNVGDGFNLFLHSDAPPGSGLGLSSTLTVSIIGLIKHLENLPLTDYDIAELAFDIERNDANVVGGKQDQYAATFGGFNFMEFLGNQTTVTPLHLRESVMDELEYRSLLCFTGKLRQSTTIIRDQMERYSKMETEIHDALMESKKIATRMKDSLLTGRLNEFGNLLNQAWMQKKKFSSMISSPHIDEIYDTARKNGALGGKILGAGGGGFMLLFCGSDQKHSVSKAVREMNTDIVDFSFSTRGVTTWEVNSDKEKPWTNGNEIRSPRAQ